jgi:hypothetical protein
MTQHDRAEHRDEPSYHDGMIEYDCRSSIRDLIRRYGFTEAREKIAYFLMDEADRKPS